MKLRLSVIQSSPSLVQSFQSVKESGCKREAGARLMNLSARGELSSERRFTCVRLNLTTFEYSLHEPAAVGFIQSSATNFTDGFESAVLD